MKVIVTAFEPFGGDAVNPSFEAAKLLPSVVSGADISVITLPVVYVGAALKLFDALIELEPNAVIETGLASGRDGITVERVAINVNDAISPDNNGIQHTDSPIIPNAPDAYFSTLPYRKIADAVKNAGYRASVSNTAGTYVCNDLMYRTLYYISSRGLPILSGFIHVPLTPSLAGKNNTPSMPSVDVAAALEIAVKTTIEMM